VKILGQAGSPKLLVSWQDFPGQSARIQVKMRRVRPSADIFFSKKPRKVQVCVQTHILIPVKRGIKLETRIMKLAFVGLLGAMALAFGAQPLHAQPFTVLHTFMPPSNTNLDGAGPAAELALFGNTLYGASSGGANGSGTNNYGTIFSINTDGSGFTVLHTFSNVTYYVIGTNFLGLPQTISVNSDGLMPRGNLILSGGTLYGAAGGGGANGSGTIFSMSTNGSNFTVLHAFATNLPAGSVTFTNADGAMPNSLVLSGGTLYGTAEQGGTNGSGTVFSLSTNGESFSVLHTFKPADGQNPQSVLALSGNNLFGITALGGQASGAAGSGTVYSLSTDGASFSVLHKFTSGANSTGGYLSGLLAVGGTLFGTTVNGATNETSAIFSINMNGSGYKEIFYFTTNLGGISPSGALLLSGDTLYGTTQQGGANGFGQVYSVNTNGGSFTTMYSFTKPHAPTNTDGSAPRTGLILSGANLLGTAYFGGNGNGTVFSLTVTPSVTNFHVAGTNLVFNGINGLAGHAYTVLASSNLALPLNQWTPVATNVLPGGGNFSITASNAANPSAAQEFYILKTPAQ
jgi:uncharacterized repeat protein (TIGR03803 family)